MIGVLAIQGGFIEHINTLGKIGAPAFEIRQKEDLLKNRIDGLIFPGGESTVIGKLIRELGLFDPLDALIRGGTPVLGTCAGAILLAQEIAGNENAYFGAIDIRVKRNAFGRQLSSFHTAGEFAGLGEIPMTFIRAPIIEEAGEEAEVLARVNGRIVAARQKNVLVTAFHPELTKDLRVHRFFFENIK